MPFFYYNRISLIVTGLGDIYFTALIKVFRTGLFPLSPTLKKTQFTLWSSHIGNCQFMRAKIFSWAQPLE